LSIFTNWRNKIEEHLAPKIFGEFENFGEFLDLNNATVDRGQIGQLGSTRIFTKGLLSRIESIRWRFFLVNWIVDISLCILGGSACCSGREWILSTGWDKSKMNFACWFVIFRSMNVGRFSNITSSRPPFVTNYGRDNQQQNCQSTDYYSNCETYKLILEFGFN
jgi:hypothetical protein